MRNTQTLTKELTHQRSSRYISMHKLVEDPMSIELTQGSPPTNIFSSIPRRHKRQKPVNRGTYERSRLSRVCQLDMKDPVIRNIPRGGVIFYTFIDDELHMCFGRDRRSSDLTDFGGCRIEKINETPVRCAVREGNEESRCAFSEINVDQVQGFSCLYSSNMLIIFIPVASPNDMDIREITKQNFDHARFLTNKQRKDRRYNEISEIVWLNEIQIDNIFSKRPAIQMFAKVRRFIYSCNQLSQDVYMMKSILRSVIIDVPQKYNIDEIQNFYLNQMSHTPTSQEILLDSHNYHTWNRDYESFDHRTFTNCSLRHSQNYSMSIYKSLNSPDGTIINDSVPVSHELTQTVHSVC
jgi:hypothetical protein